MMALTESMPRARVYATYKAALAKGALVRPSRCEDCGTACAPHGHHDDYSKPLEVQWLCRPCHTKADRARRLRVKAAIAFEAVTVIERALASGSRVPDAITAALGCAPVDFASRHGFAPQAVTMFLNGYHQRPYPEIRDAICAELEIPRPYLDRLIDSQVRAERAESEPAA